LGNVRIVARHLNITEAIKKYALQKAGDYRNGKFLGYTRGITGNNSIGGRLSYEIN